MRQLLKRGASASGAILLALCTVAAGENAEQTFDSLFGEKMKKVAATKDTGDDVVLARELLAAAAKAQTQPELLAVMCQKAYALVQKNPGGYRTAIEAMEYLAEKVPARKEACQDALVDLHQYRYTRTKGYDRKLAGEALVKAMLAAADAKAEVGKYREAAALAGRAYRFAAVAVPDKKEELKAALKQFQDREKTAARIERMRRRLKANPKDRAARSALIKMYVSELDDPTRAAALLTTDSDEQLRTYVPLAAKDIEEVAESVCLELGDWYRELSRKAGPGGKRAMLARAKRYYQRYLSAHDAKDAAGLKARLALDQLRKELAKYGVTDAPKTTVRKMSEEILAFAKQRAPLPPEKQLAVTWAKLRQVNGGKRIYGTGIIEADKVVSIDLRYHYRRERRENRGLANIDPLYGLPLTSLNLAGCTGLTGDLAALAGMELTHLNLAGCNNLQSLNGLEGLPLKSLSLPAVKSMRGNLTFLRRMKLTSLTVTGDITSLDGIQGMPLETLTVYNCRKLLGDLSALKELPLARLSISGCGINSLNGIQRLKLTSLTLSGCNYLRSLRGLEALPLENLSAVYCANLRDISALKGSKTLTTLNLSGCSSLRDVAALRGTKLTKLNLYRCYKLSSLNGIQNLPLVEINLQGCGSLRKKDYLLLARIPTLASLRTGDEKRDDEILKRCEKLREKNR